MADLDANREEMLNNSAAAASRGSAVGVFRVLCGLWIAISFAYTAGYFYVAVLGGRYSHRRTPNGGVRAFEPPRQLAERLVHHGPNGGQRMILPHARFRRQITKDVILFLIVSAHAFSYHTRLWIASSLSAVKA